MTCFHGFIALNNPSGMPIEWNILMIWGAWFLFGVHHEASITAVASMPFLVTFLAFWLVLVPAYGNLVPSRVSFLLAMRYYAGNWAYNIWLVRRDALHKLDRLTKMAGTMREQLASLLPDPQQVDVACSMSLAHRFLHLEGRPLLEALPKAVDDIDAYEWMDGEVFGGMVVRLELRRRPPERHAAPRRRAGAVRLRERRGASDHGRVATALRPDDAVEGRGCEARHHRRGRDGDRGDARRAAVADGCVRGGARRSCGKRRLKRERPVTGTMSTRPAKPR